MIWWRERKEVKLAQLQAEYDILYKFVTKTEHTYWDREKLMELAGKIAKLKKELELTQR